MYKSWVPPAQGSFDLVALSKPRRALLALLFARAARAYNWGVCVDGLGNSMFRYFTTLGFFHDFAVHGMLPGVDRAPGTTMHNVFSALNRTLRGAHACSACLISQIDYC
jgi:hypothetical protein